MITIIDYGAGNLFSVQNALNFLGLSNQISKDPRDLERADALILPGVGAFPVAMQMLKKTGLIDTIRSAVKQKPLLGICLGMQMLLESSTEGGLHRGLGFLKGEITRFAIEARVPHVGWNTVKQLRGCPILSGVDGEHFYFVHSFCAQDETIAAAAGLTEYETTFASVVWTDNVFGTQFHPEKSGEAGLKLLKNFASLPSPLV